MVGRQRVLGPTDHQSRFLSRNRYFLRNFPKKLRNYRTNARNGGQTAIKITFSKEMTIVFEIFCLSTCLALRS